MTDDGDERLQATHCDAEWRVLDHVEHVQRLGELNQVDVEPRLDDGHVEVDAGIVLTVIGTDTQTVDQQVQSTGNL